MESRKPKILLIDDEASILVTFQLALVKEGYHVVAEQRGKTGLERALKERFDGIIIDHRLSDVTGLEIAQTLRAAGQLTPILLVSASESPLDMLKPALPKVKFEAKPLQPQTLRAAIDGFFERGVDGGN